MWSRLKGRLEAGAVTAFVAAGLALAPAGARAQFAGEGHMPTLAPLVRRVAPAVVNISIEGHRAVASNPMLSDPFFRQFFGTPDNAPQTEQRFEAAGSGVIIDAAKGYVLTNAHVVDQADQITVILADSREFKAKLIGTDPESDIAVLQIKPDHLTELPLGDSDQLQVGDYVVAVGNPFGLGGTVTAGNASQISDGAAAVVVADREAAAAAGLPILAEILGYGQMAGPDATLHDRPARALGIALDRAGVELAAVGGEQLQQPVLDDDRQAEGH